MQVAKPSIDTIHLESDKVDTYELDKRDAGYGDKLLGLTSSCRFADSLCRKYVVKLPLSIHGDTIMAIGSLAVL